MKRCPKCNAEMEQVEDEPDVDIHGGWYCHQCGHDIAFHEVDDDLEYE